MAFLLANDLVRMVSPASSPERDVIDRHVEVLRTWGLRVEIASHAFDHIGFLAGTDDDRLADLTDALVDPSVRAVFTTRGGKGSYRIAHRLPFEAIARDPKPIIGFSDITVLQLCLWRTCSSMSVHGALTSDAKDRLSPIATRSLRAVLLGDDPITVQADSTIQSATLTTYGIARGPLIGGNLDMIATAAGWALPPLRDAVLLIESAGLPLGRLDRALTMLVRAGYLDGIAAIAVGHISGTRQNAPIDAIDLLRQHLSKFNVPILGGLPIGHDAHSRSVVIGMPAEIDADAGTLTQRPSR